MALVVWLVLTFRDRLDHSTPLTRELAESSYGAFILHAPVLVLTSIALLLVGLPPIPKLLLTGVIAVPGCFLLAGLVRRLPIVRRVI